MSFQPLNIFGTLFAAAPIAVAQYRTQAPIDFPVQEPFGCHDGGFGHTGYVGLKSGYIHLSID